MDDRDIVAAIVAGDDDGIAYAYDKYAASLYGYCRWIAPEPADVAVPVQDTFIIAAARLGGLRDPMMLRPWLYAVARNECRRLPRQAAPGQAVPGQAVPRQAVPRPAVPGPAAWRQVRAHRPAQACDDAELARAMAELDPAEREIMELNLRHHMAGGDLAAVLGVSRRRVHALLSHARGRLEESLGGSPDRAALARPAAPPRMLREEVLRSCAEDTAEATAYREWVTRRAGRFGPGGFPRPAARSRHVLAMTGAAAAAAILVAVTSTGIVTVLTFGSAHTPRPVDALRGGVPSAAGTGATQIVTPAGGASATPRGAATPAAPAGGIPVGRGRPSASGRPRPTVPPGSQPAPSPPPASPRPKTSSSPSPSESPTSPSPAHSPSSSPGLQWPPSPQPSATFP